MDTLEREREVSLFSETPPDLSSSLSSSSSSLSSSANPLDLAKLAVLAAPLAPPSDNASSGPEVGGDMEALRDELGIYDGV